MASQLTRHSPRYRETTLVAAYPMGFSRTIELVGQGVDAAGVALIVIGVIYATARFFLRLREGQPRAAYAAYRETLGKTLLLGLEFLVAADVIRTVAVAPTFVNVGLLAIIVLIRTFLSWSLELELEGRWPWQQRSSGQGQTLSAAPT